jgi:hypothetical protein
MASAGPAGVSLMAELAGRARFISRTAQIHFLLTTVCSIRPSLSRQHADATHVPAEKNSGD